MGELAIDAPTRLARLLDLPPETRMRGRLPNRLVELYTAASRFEEAFQLLATHRFHPWEGERGMRKVYTDAYMQHATSLEAEGDWDRAAAAYDEALRYPLNVGVGKPLRSADSEIHWRAARAAEKLAKPDAAREHWQAAICEDHHALTSPHRLYVELSRAALGDREAAHANLVAMGRELDALPENDSASRELRARVQEALDRPT